jgi:hypothetical protein
MTTMGQTDSTCCNCRRPQAGQDGLGQAKRGQPGLFTHRTAMAKARGRLDPKANVGSVPLGGPQTESPALAIRD